jgi:SAM-dependent methyltransferase
MSFKIPWFLKMAGKMTIARLPLSHNFWFRLGIFKHGQMQDFNYAHGVFKHHLALAGLEGGGGNGSKVVLELGPGESLFSAVLAKAYGFKGSILLDVGNFSLPEVAVYRDFTHWLQSLGFTLPSLDACSDIAQSLAILQSRYLTEGLTALKTLPDQSVDLIFSQAVLEHVRKKEMVETFREIHRILKPEGCSTHVIDLKDHLQSSLNSLRFNEEFWESPFVSNSGFYTNRLRFNDYMSLFSTSGFQVDVISKSEWKNVPLKKWVLAPQFRALPGEILKISDCTVRLRSVVAME